MFPIIDRHILKEWAKIFLMALGAMIGMLLISAIYNNLQDFMGWGTPTSTTLEFFGMTAIGFLPVVIPVSLLVSLLFILGHFHKNQEITAWRAAGLGIFRITRSLWIAGAVLSGLMLWGNATLVPYATEQTAKIIAESELAFKRKTGNYSASNSRGEFLFYNNSADGRNWLISRFSPYTGTGYGINIYNFEKGDKPAHALYAEFGEFDEKTHTWTLHNGREIFYEKGISVPTSQPAFDKKVVSGFTENPRLMSLVGKKPGDLSIPEIREILQEIGVKENSSRIAEYSVRYNSILASPFCCLIVVGIAIPFAVAGVRTNPMVGVSKSIGLFAVYFVLTNVFNALGTKQILPPVAAAWAPNVLLLAYAAWLCRKVN
ncbi:MAG: LptF/LptG family permease [Opitutae bacterium]|nr:LptF/LptG family permease [Opitutae bacterium]MCD8298291.1 LptF/LptG family permease [Opitutae bacterium]